VSGRPLAPTTRILRRARALLARRGGWTKNTAARDRAGVPIAPDSAAAVCFCASGAIDRAVLDLGIDWDWSRKARMKLLRAVGGGLAIPEFNDAPSRRKKEVLEAFKRAEFCRA
jgi:hypothetical protein